MIVIRRQVTNVTCHYDWRKGQVILKIWPIIDHWLAIILSPEDLLLYSRTKLAYSYKKSLFKKPNETLLLKNSLYNFLKQTALHSFKLLLAHPTYKHSDMRVKTKTSLIWKILYSTQKHSYFKHDFYRKR